MKPESSENERVESDSHKLKYFFAGIAIGFLVILISVFMGSNKSLMASGIIIMGLTIGIFPFCTPDTVKLIGYRNSKLFGRILGVILIGVGIWVKVG